MEDTMDALTTGKGKGKEKGAKKGKRRQGKHPRRRQRNSTEHAESAKKLQRSSWPRASGPLAQRQAVGNFKPSVWTASGHQLPVVGIKVPVVELENGDHMSLTFAVMDLTAPLAEASRMVKAGRAVVFSHDESFVQSSKGLRHLLIESNGVYIVRARIPN